MISKSKIVLRIQQIENSIDQARMMLNAMNKIKTLVVGTTFLHVLQCVLYEFRLAGQRSSM